MLIRSASGLRGIVKDDFSPEIIDRHIASFILNQEIGHCVIGRDGRQSGKEISQWVIDSLTKYGVNVDNCDLATTPTIQLMTEKEQYDGGIIITASHNPSEYNGLKFLQKDGTFLSTDQCKKLFAKADRMKESVAYKDPSKYFFQYNSSVLDATKTDFINIIVKAAGGTGEVSVYHSADKEHIDKVLSISCINIENICSKKFKVVIDAVNGAGSTILPELCKKLGCDVTIINCNGDGNFTRIPEPIALNLKDLENKVIEVGADIGFATDPDGDRLSIVSNKGKAIGEEYTLVFALINWLTWKKSNAPKVIPTQFPNISRKNRFVVVTNFSTSQMIDDISSSLLSIHRTHVGEAHVVSEMRDLGAEIGGEGNGGVILKEVHLGRDSLVAIALVLNLMASSRKSVSDMLQLIPNYVFLKEKMNTDTTRIVDLKYFNDEKIMNLFVGYDESISSLTDPLLFLEEGDGIKFIWNSEKKWVQARTSNTEPIIRIFAEAKTKNEAKDLIQTLKDYLK